MPTLPDLAQGQEWLSGRLTHGIGGPRTAVRDTYETRLAGFQWVQLLGEG